MESIRHHLRMGWWVERRSLGPPVAYNKVNLYL